MGPGRSAWSISPVCSNGPGTFSPFDVVGHLIDGEREDWIPRLDIILNDGPARPFAPFDHGSKGKPGDGDTVGARLATFDPTPVPSCGATFLVKKSGAIRKLRRLLLLHRCIFML